jgi:hypothetical protein
MIVYKLNEAGDVVVSTDTSWRDLSGEDILPGFSVSSVELDMVLNQVRYNLIDNRNLVLPLKMSWKIRNIVANVIKNS